MYDVSHHALVEFQVGVETEVKTVKEIFERSYTEVSLLNIDQPTLRQWAYHPLEFFLHVAFSLSLEHLWILRGTVLQEANSHFETV